MPIMKNKTAKNVGIILGCSIIAKALSYAWEAILAAYFGASDQADAIYMTSSIFGILYPILDLGIWKVFLPAYKTKLVTKKNDEAESIANIAITLFFSLSVALVLFLFVFSKPIVSIIAPGFSAEKKAMTIGFLRISVPTYLLMATASVIGAILQSHDRFLGSQIREIGTHVSKILFMLLTYHRIGVVAALIAPIIGSICRLLVQLPFVNWKWRFRPSFRFNDKNIIPMLKGLPSVALTAAIAQINGMVDKIIASGAYSGAIACLNYGHRLMNVFSGMISNAISTAIYPTMIQYIAKKEREQLKGLLQNVICILEFFIVPISVFCFLFSEDLVTVAFQRGAFDRSATELTASVFVGYSMGMLFLGIGTVITNVFYSHGDTKKTLYISIVEIVLKIIFNLIFVRLWGVAGLAYATSISAAICLVIRLILMNDYVRIDYRIIAKETVKILFISVVACIVPYITVTYLVNCNVFVSLLISLVMAGGLFLLLAFVFRLDAFMSLKRMVVSKIHGKSQS